MERPDINAIEKRANAETPGDGAVVVCSDNHARQGLSDVVRRGLKAREHLGEDKIADYVLVPRQNVTGAGRTFVRNYRPGDVQENGNFIAHARADVPSLIAYIRELEQRWDDMQEDERSRD